MAKQFGKRCVRHNGIGVSRRDCIVLREGLQYGFARASKVALKARVVSALKSVYFRLHPAFSTSCATLTVRAREATRTYGCTGGELSRRRPRIRCRGPSRPQKPPERRLARALASPKIHGRFLRCMNFLVQNCAVWRQTAQDSIHRVASEKQAAQDRENGRKKTLGN